MLSVYEIEHTPKDWRPGAIPKKSGGVRHIDIPNDKLKEIQSEILYFLYDLWFDHKIQISSVAHGFLPGQDIMTGVIRHDRKSPVMACFDMTDFFDKCPTEPAKGQLYRADCVPRALTDAIMGAAVYNGHFPQGGPLSPFMTNLSMYDADCMIAAYSKKNGWFYTRYADDMTFSLIPDHPKRQEIMDCPSLAAWLLSLGVETILSKSMGLHLNPKKTHCILRGKRTKPQVLGVIVRQDGFGYNAPKKFRLDTRAAVYNLYHKIEKQNGMVFDEDKLEWNIICGRAQFMKYVRSYSDAGYDCFDPFIQSELFNSLERRLGNIVNDILQRPDHIYTTHEDI